MDQREIVVSDAKLELAHGFDEWSGLDVSDCSSKLDNADIRLLVGLVYGDRGHALNPILDRVRKVGNDLAIRY